MRARRELITIAAAAFAGGFALGSLVASRSGRTVRRTFVSKAHESTLWVSARLHEIERQVCALERQLALATADYSRRLDDLAGKAVQHYVPQMPDQPEAWELDDEDVSRELRHLPRG